MPWFSLFQPSAAQMDAIMADGRRLPFNHDSVGWTMDVSADQLQLPDGLLWAKDHLRVKVGEGLTTYNKAKALLEKWDHFDLGWSYVPRGTQVTTGSPVAVAAHTFFLWTAQPLRIVYNKEESESKKLPRLPLGWLLNRLPGPVGRKRWQFAQNCVEGHILQGEESFRVEWNSKDDAVWYEVLTISRPIHPLPLVTYPITRYFQAKFRQETVAAVTAALNPGQKTKQSNSSPAAALSLALVPGRVLPAAGLFGGKQDAGLDLWDLSVPLEVGATSLGV